jgi:hypothetical protein
MQVRVVGAFLVCTVLGGCQTLNEFTGRTTPALPEAAPASAPETPPAVAAPAARIDETSSLAGLDAARLLQMWGEPTVRRREAGAELWTYGKPRAGCTVLVYLYPGAGGAMTVTRSEALPGGTGSAAVSACARANALSPTS